MGRGGMDGGGEEWGVPSPFSSFFHAVSLFAGEGKKEEEEIRQNELIKNVIYLKSWAEPQNHSLDKML